MFEEIVEKKYNPLKEICDELKIISPESINSSNLPAFAKNFLIAEQIEINNRELLNSLLEKSVKLIVNYSLRPKWTILNYLFGGFDSKPSDEIIKKIEVFQFYRYYIDLISNHIKDNALMFLTKDEIKYLIEEANKVVLDKLVNNTSSIKVKNFFSQVYKLKYGDEREINLDWSVPFLFIKLFLEDKEFDNLLDKFKIIPGLDDTMEIEMKTAIKIFTDKYYVNDNFFVLKTDSSSEISQSLGIEKEEEKDEREEKTIEEKYEKTEEIKTNSNSEDKTIEKTEKNILSSNEKIKEEVDDKPRGIIQFFKNIKNKRFLKGKETKEEKRETESKIGIVSIEEKEQYKEEKQIRRNKEILRNEEKIRYIFKGDELKEIQKKIFKGSKSFMYETFGELERFDDWQEASEYLKEFFIKNKVSLYNKYTVLFVDILSEHFLNLEKEKQ